MRSLTHSPTHLQVAQQVEARRRLLRPPAATAAATAAGSLLQAEVHMVAVGEGPVLAEEAMRE